MAEKMKLTALFTAAVTVFCTALYIYSKNGLLFTLAISFGTASYHLIMRLIVGFSVNLLMNNHADYRKKWFQVNSSEQKFYGKIKVKNWKGKMATYDPDCFDSRIHTWDEIAQATCQAELVHEIIIILSFIPVFASACFGALSVFVITSVLAACYDAMFVIMQRYNRPRIIKIIKKAKKNQSD